MNINLKELNIEQAHSDLSGGVYTVRELVDAYLEVIKEKNGDLNAYLEIFDDLDNQIKTAEEKFKNKNATLLTGIPIAIKDNILIKGHIASASSKILENYTASYDSTVIKILREEGAIFLGRTNMDEFAMGSSTETSAYGITRNPIDRELVPGGSSGGSASALGADMALVSLGTETCGSVREPAAFCNLVGLKPTYGAVSRHGIIAMGNSLDQVSPFGKNVRDAEIVFNTISKYDKLDNTSILENERVIKIKDANKKKIGIPWHLFESGVDESIMVNFKQSVEKLKNAGYEIVDISLPFSKYSLAVYYIIMPAEVSTNLSRFDGVRYGTRKEGENIWESFKKSRSYGFGIEARRRIILGTYVLSHGYYDAYYNKAWKIRRAIMKEINDAFDQVGFIMTPTVPVLPFKLGEKMNDPLAMYLCDLFSAPANLTGAPSIAIPSGKNEKELPFSVQFTAPHFSESSLFEIGKEFEKLN
ncbi:MAG: Asp-tRNA(Asn)/Glu-tRNA(Gln) amidotransferase subunit GatA [Candidatus Pacebacteria bacterium]|nr:Asp-tRNA(Asn)/Glu-tRNA(Gln) amidotransferase subunit GatA [Candidatus Paceibacterota bacterium]